MTLVAAKCDGTLGWQWCVVIARVIEWRLQEAGSISEEA